MKDAPLHSYPWYVSDWRGSETRLTLPSEAKYVFRELLDHCWIEGSFPNDESTMARIAAVELKEFRSVWPLLKDKFVEANGRLSHWRVLEKRGKLQSWANSRVKGGENGGNSKAERLAIATGKARSKGLAQGKDNPLPPLTLTLPSVPTEPSETAAARETAPPPDPDAELTPQQRIAAAVHSIAVMWPNSFSEPAARKAAESVWQASGILVDDWCQSLSASAGRWVRYHRANRKKRGHFIPTLPRWLTDGDHSRNPPGEDDTEPQKPVCGTCGGSGQYSPTFHAEMTEGEFEASKKPCPDCAKGPKCP